MATYTWTSHPIAEFFEYYQEGCYLPAYSDYGYLYYNQLYRYDQTAPPDPITGMQPPATGVDCEVDTTSGSILYEAWHRQDRNASTCYKCDQRMTIDQFQQLPYLGDGSTLGSLPTIPDPGPPP